MFHIAWSISDEEWEIARSVFRAVLPGSEYDSIYRTRVHVLWGSLQISHYENDLFPTDSVQQLHEYRYQKRRVLLHPRMHLPPWLWPISELTDTHGIKISITEFLFKSNEALFKGFESRPQEGPAVIELNDPEITMVFTGSTDNIVVMSSLFEVPRLVVEQADFFRGVGAFIVEIIHDIHQRAPELLFWESFRDVLNTYSSFHTLHR